MDFSSLKLPLLLASWLYCSGPGIVVPYPWPSSLLKSIGIVKLPWVDFSEPSVLIEFLAGSYFLLGGVDDVTLLYLFIFRLIKSGVSIQYGYLVFILYCRWISLVKGSASCEGKEK